MTPLTDIAARDYPDVSRDTLGILIQAIEGHMEWIEDTRYRRAVVLLLLRAHLLDKPAYLLAAARLVDAYTGERHDHIH